MFAEITYWVDAKAKKSFIHGFIIKDQSMPTYR